MLTYRFFFFRQKTAYEMRISDWSSDVCFFRSVAAVLAVEFEEGWDPKDFSPEKFRQAREARNLSRRGLAQLSGLSEWTFQWWEEGRSKDRKSGAEGKSGAVRVNTGGGRSSKKRKE